MTDWKEITRRVREMHEGLGGAAIMVPSGINMFSFTPPLWMVGLKGPRLEVDGPLLSVKKIRTFLFENRGVRALHRDKLVVWSLYDPKEDGGVSVLGLGTLTDERVGLRMKPRLKNPECSFEFLYLPQEVSHA